MTAIAESLLPALVRTTLWLSLAVLVVEVLLQIARPRSVDLHRAGWVLALLVGWLFVGPRVEVPWYAVSGAAVTHAKPPLEVAQAPLELRDLHTAISSPLEASGPPVVDVNDLRTSAAAPLDTPIVAEEPTWWQRGRAALAAIDWRAKLPLLLVATWISGMIVMAGITLWSYLRLVRRVGEPSQLDEELKPEWQTQWRSLLAAEGVRREIPLRATSGAGPSLCRLPRGYVLLVPIETWSELTVAARAAILRHELTHYRRGDVWKSLAVRVLALPHWFNPAAWWSVRRFDEAAEWACDRAAVAELPATEFAAILVNLGAAPTPHASFNPAARGRSLATRVRRHLSGEPREDSMMKKLLVLVSAALVMVAAAVRLELVAQELTAPPTPASPPEAEQPQVKVETTIVEPPQAVANEPADDAAAELLAASRKGFEAANAAYHSGTATLDLVCQWSERWLAAELEVDTNPDKQVEYSRQHLKRLEQLHAQVKALFDVAAQGGETEKLALTEYNVALAKRHLVQLEQRAAQWHAEARRARANADALARNPFGATPAAAGSGAPPAADAPPAANVPAGFPEGVDMQSARYDGKSFDEWATVLQQELSPARRAVAIEALAAFSAYDKALAKMAALQIVRAMRSNRSWYIDTTPAGVMYKAAIDSFNSIDREVGVPVLVGALKSDDAATRRFALNVFAFGLVAPPEGVAKIVELTKDENPEVRRDAVVALARVDRTSPAIFEALSDDKPMVVSMAIAALAPVAPGMGGMGGNQFVPSWNSKPIVPQPELVKKLSELAARSDGTMPLRTQAIAALGRLGTAAVDAVPLLEQLRNSPESEVSAAATDAGLAIYQALQIEEHRKLSPPAGTPAATQPEQVDPIPSQPEAAEPGAAAPVESEPRVETIGDDPFALPVEETTGGEAPTGPLTLDASDGIVAATVVTGPVELKHDDNTSAGKRSIAGSGHLVRFAAPQGKWNLTSVRIFGSRYGYPQTPKYFKVWVCDADLKPIAEFEYPYAKFKRGDPQWVEFKTKPTVISKEFYLCVGFDPQQTSGVYVHYDGEASGSSAVGLRDWLIRPTLSPVDPKDASNRAED
jgi:beta-lactamase regulating signal transducer with metallopeptidase domain/HEAT repeat protein